MPVIEHQLSRVGILNLPQFEWFFTTNNELYTYVLDGIPDSKIDRNRVNSRNIKLTIDSYSLLKKLQHFGYNHVLILEDDISFHNDIEFIRDVVSSTPDDFDVMNYDPDILVDSNGKPFGRFQSINENIQRYENAKIVNMSCCALSKKAIDLMVYRQKTLLEPFDIYTWTNTKDLKTYCVNIDKNICIQDLNSFESKQSDRQYGDKYKVVNIDNYTIGHSREYGEDKPDVIVSLTSYPYRFKKREFMVVLRSLVGQNTKYNYKIVLTLFKDDISQLPRNVSEYMQDNGIEVISAPLDIRQHKKYYYVMQKYRGIPVITVDDDTDYSENLVEDLFSTHLANPDRIVCGRCCKVAFDQQGNPLQYNLWQQWVDTPNLKDDNLFAVGVGGVLYPEKFGYIMDYRIPDLIPHIPSDDVLLYILAGIMGIKYMTVNTKNKFSKTAGVGFFFKKDNIAYHNDDKAMWIVNNVNGYKDKSVGYIGKYNSLDELIEQVQSE